METANQIDWKENWKNSSLLFKSKSLLNKESSLSLYFSYIHRYAIVAWASTYMTNLKKKQKNKNMLFASYLTKESVSTQDICLN